MDMEQGLPMYNGAVAQVAQQQFSRVPALPRVQGMGEVFDRAVGAGLDSLEKYSRLHDFGEQQRVEHMVRMADLGLQQEIDKGLHAKWGTRESFFNEDGTQNYDNMCAVVSRWQDVYADIEANFLLRDSAMRDAAMRSSKMTDVDVRVNLSASEQAFRNRREAFEANYALAVEQGDVDGARAALAGAVEAGQILPKEAKKRELALSRRGERERLRGLRSQGRAGAEMAVDALLGLGADVAPEVDAVKVVDTAAPASSEVVTLSGGGEAGATEAPVLGGAAESMGGGDLTLDEDMVRDVAQRREARSITLTPEEYAAEFRSSVAQSMQFDAQGLDIGYLAPEGAKVAVSKAKAEGGWTKARYKEAIYALGQELLENEAYSHLSDDEMAKLMREAMFIPGMGEELWADEMAPEAANESMVQGVIDNLMSCRNGKVRERVKYALAGGQGYAAIELPEDDGLAEYVFMRACEAVGAYRKGGGDNWSVEQSIITNAIGTARNEYNGGAAWERHRAEQGAVDLAAAKVREQKVKYWRGRVAEKQSASMAKAEAKKKAEAETKKKTRAKTKEELLKERPYTGEMELYFTCKGNDIRRATLTVPAAEYEKMCEQFEVGENDLLYANLGGKRTEFLVVPGQGSGWFVNREAAVVLLSGRKDQKAAAGELSSGMQTGMKLTKKRVVGNK